MTTSGLPGLAASRTAAVTAARTSASSRSCGVSSAACSGVWARMVPSSATVPTPCQISAISSEKSAARGQTPPTPYRATNWSRTSCRTGRY